nr:immunoglobulin light chain junction region [Macaca mulatta]
CMQALQAPFTC